MADSSARTENVKWAALAVLLFIGFAITRSDSCQSEKGENHESDAAAVASPQPDSKPLNVPSLTRDTFDPLNDRSEEGIRLNIQQADKSITYEQLKKNADRYDGEPWAFSGKVFQIQEAGGQTTALVSLDTWGNKMMYVRAKFTTEFVEKDQVYVVGYLAGNYSYRSVAGWELTVPVLDARAIIKPSEVARIKAHKAEKKNLQR